MNGPAVPPAICTVMSLATPCVLQSVAGLCIAELTDRAHIRLSSLTGASFVGTTTGATLIDDVHQMMTIDNH